MSDKHKIKRLRVARDSWMRAYDRSSTTVTNMTDRIHELSSAVDRATEKLEMGDAEGAYKILSAVCYKQDS